MWRDPILNSNHKTVINGLLATAIVLLVASCNFFEDAYPPPPNPPQTEILRIDILPNDTLAPGDTATFRCIIADSLDPRFKFYWGLDGDNDPNAIITDSSLVNWIAPNESRSYLHTIRVDNDSEDSSSVFESFEVYVIEQ